MSDSYFEELMQRIERLTDLDARASAKIADALMEAHDEVPPSPAEIVETAIALGFEIERKHSTRDDAPENASPLPEVTTNPVEVLAEVYKVMPRVLTTEHPRIGRAPKSSVFYNEEIQSAIDALPEHIRVLIADLDLFNGQCTITVYDEANDIDRTIGPISLEHYPTPDALTRAVEALVTRLPRVLAADGN